ncbi:MAG: enoyl-CoA hydratase-related protein [Anaerolineae bacterium]
MTDKVLVDRQGPIWLLTINRPQVRNAVDPKTMTALREAVEAASADADSRVVVIRGAGGAFSSGADLSAAGQASLDRESAIRTLTEVYHPTMKAIRACPWPVIAAIDGPAAGIGLDLALACDIRLASDRAVFAELFVRRGLVPDGGGTWSLQRLVGVGRALELILTGESVPAEEALRIGLANKVYAYDIFEVRVLEYAAALAAQAPLALVRAKKAVYAAQTSAFDQALAQEAVYQGEIFASEDAFEGFRAFLEKRPPQWKGR